MNRPTYRERYAAIIRYAVRHLRTGTPLAERIAAVDAARPYYVNATSWDRKAWQAARRDALEPYGYEARTKKAQARRDAVVAPLPLLDGRTHDEAPQGAGGGA